LKILGKLLGGKGLEEVSELVVGQVMVPGEGIRDDIFLPRNPLAVRAEVVLEE
jgi:hypothetical protein